MTDYRNEEINPEDYWPVAEKMLDEHFKAKRRRMILVIAAMLLLTSAGIYLAIGPKEVNEAATINHSKEVHANATVIEKLPVSGSSEKIQTIVKEQVPVNANKNNLTSNPSTQKNQIIIANSLKPAVPAVRGSGKVTRVTSPYLISGTTGTVNNSSLPSGQQPIVEKDTVPLVNILQEPTNTDLSIHMLPAKPIYLIQEDTTKTTIGLSGRSLKNKGSARWDLLMYAGAGVVRKELSGSSNTVYLQRRNDEEKNLLLPYAGLQISKSIKNWDIRGGVELSIVGEEVKYSPFTKGEYYNTYQDWQPYQYSINDTDSTYIYGILFMHTTSVTVNDSQLVTLTDTLNGVHYNPSLNAANGFNHYYIAEVPVDVTYQLSRGKFGFGLSAGLAPGMVVKTEGKYLRADESGYEEVQRQTKGQFTLNARAGIEFSYLLNTRCRILLRPSGRYFLTTIHESNGAAKRYSMVGVNAGLMYMIR